METWNYGLCFKRELITQNLVWSVWWSKKSENWSINCKCILLQFCSGGCFLVCFPDIVFIFFVIRALRKECVNTRNLHLSTCLKTDQICLCISLWCTVQSAVACCRDVPKRLAAAGPHRFLRASFHIPLCVCVDVCVCVCLWHWLYKYWQYIYLLKLFKIEAKISHIGRHFISLVRSVEAKTWRRDLLPTMETW